jgi:hypothetical protein
MTITIKTAEDAAKAALANVAIWLEKRAWKEYLDTPRNGRALPFNVWLRERIKAMSEDASLIPGPNG